MKKLKNKKLKKSNKKNSLLVLAALLALAVLGAGAYLKFIKDDTANVSQAEQEAAEQADVDEAKKRADELEESSDDPLKDVDEPNPSTPTTPNNSVSISAPTFSQTNRMINSSVIVSGATSGNCKFTFTDADGRPVAKTVTLSNGSCSVSISEAEFTLLGTWILNVEFGGKNVTRNVEVS